MTDTITLTDQFQINDEVRVGEVTGTVCGIFPPENEVEVQVWVSEPYTCDDGTHVAGCWGTVIHTHPGSYERRVFPAADVTHS